MARSYFKIYFSSRRMLEMLTDEQRGRVLMAAIDYAEKDTPPLNLSTEEGLVFEGLRVWIDAGRETYDRQAAANQQNGKQGGRPKKANGFFLHGKAKAKAKANTDGIAAAVAAAPSAPEAPPGSEPPPLPPEQYFVQQGFGTEAFGIKVLGEYRAKGCSDDLLIRCMDEALAYGFAKWGYVRSVLERCLREDIHEAGAFDASRQRRGTGHSTRVDRPAPSGNNFLADAVNRQFRSKRKD